MSNPSADRIQRQYEDSSRFNARVRLHRFATNRYGTFRWIFDNFAIPADGRVLELGSGTAILWTQNATRIPPEWRVTLSDFSLGMLREVRTNASKIGRTFSFAQMDAQHLPFPDHAFDAVIANYMLYHVQDIPRALREIRRILVPGGQCYAATNGRGNMREFSEIVKRYVGGEVSRAAFYFGLENGHDLMRDVFPEVKLLRYPDSLVVTEVQPLIDYIDSTSIGSMGTDEQRAALRRHLEAELAEKGAIHISKETGMLIATA